MPNLTDFAIRPSSFLVGDPTFGQQAGVSSVKPVMLYGGLNTFAWNLNLPEGTEFAQIEGTQREFVAPRIPATELPDFKADVAPLGVWEGVVVEVDDKARVMQVLLDAKMGQMPRHTAEVDLDSVSPQDIELVRPGAVFYLTLYKRTRPSVENIEELRFRRRPAWSQTQLTQVDKEASDLLSKMKALPTAV